MPLQDFLDRLTLTRRLVKAVERTAAALEAQNSLLQRLADHFAPMLPPVTEQDVSSSGPSFRRQDQLARLEEWVKVFMVRSGREPNDFDIEEWLREDAERV